MSNSIPPLVCSTPPPIDDFVDQLDDDDDDDDIRSEEDEDTSISSTPKKSSNSITENNHELDLPNLDDDNLQSIPPNIQSTYKNKYDEPIKIKKIENDVHIDEKNISNINSDTIINTTTTLTTSPTPPTIENKETLPSNNDQVKLNEKDKLNNDELEIEIKQIDQSIQINNSDDDLPADIEINQITNKFNNLFRSESPPSLVLSTSNSFEEYDQPNSESEPSLKLDSINNSIDSSPEHNIDNLSPTIKSISQNNNENINDDDQNNDIENDDDDDDNNFDIPTTFDTSSLNFDKSIDLENVKSNDNDDDDDVNDEDDNDVNENDDNQIEINIKQTNVEQNENCDNFNDSFDDFIVYSDMNNLETPINQQENPTITHLSDENKLNEENKFIANFDADFSQFNAFENDAIIEKSSVPIITQPSAAETVTTTTTTARTYSLDNFDDDDDDFGDFDAVPIVNTTTEPTKIINSNDKNNDDDDDFGDFSDFSQNQPSIPIISTNLDQVFEMLPNLLEIMFPTSTTNTIPPSQTDEIDNESSTVKKEDTLENEIDNNNQYDKDFHNDTTKSIKNFENSKALEHQWLTSVGKTTLVKALGIDSRNILYGGKWNSNMPRFAANLGCNPLEPVKSSGTSITGGSNSNNRLNDIPAVQFDWNSSGLVNPLDASHAHTLLLDLEQLVVVANLDKIKLDSSTCTSASSIQSSSTQSLSSSSFLHHHYNRSIASPIKTTITTTTTTTTTKTMINNTNNSKTNSTITNSDSLFSFGGGNGAGGGIFGGNIVGHIGGGGGSIVRGGSIGGNIPFGCDCGADHISSLVDSTSGISYFDDEHINVGAAAATAAGAGVITNSTNLSSLNNLNTIKNIGDGYSLLSSYTLFSSSSLTSTSSSTSSTSTTSPSSLLSTTITTTSKFNAPTNVNNNNNLNDILVMDKHNFTTNNNNNHNINNNTNQLGLFDDFLDIRVQEILHQANITQTQSSWMESDWSSSSTKSVTSISTSTASTTTATPTIASSIPATTTIINPTSSITTSTDTTITFTTTTTAPTTTSSQFQSTPINTMSENIEIQLNENDNDDNNVSTVNVSPNQYIENTIDIEQLQPAPISSSYVVPGCGSLKETHIFTPNKASLSQQQQQQIGGRNSLGSLSASSSVSSASSVSPPSTTPPLAPITTPPPITSTTPTTSCPDYDFKEAAAGIIINESVVKKEYRDVEYNPDKLAPSIKLSTLSINDEFSDFQSVSNTVPNAIQSSVGILQPIKSKDSEIIINWPDPGNVIDQNTSRYDLCDNFNDYTMNLGVNSNSTGEGGVNDDIESVKVSTTNKIVIENSLDSLTFVQPAQEDDFSDFIAAPSPKLPPPPPPPVVVQQHQHQQFIPPSSIIKEPSTPMVPLQPSVILTPKPLSSQQSSSLSSTTMTPIDLNGVSNTENITSVSSNINWPDPGIDPDEMARLEALFPTPKIIPSTITSPSPVSPSPVSPSPSALSHQSQQSQQSQSSPMKPKSSKTSSSSSSSSPKSNKNRLAGDDVEWSDFVSGTGTQQPITNIINQHIGRHHHQHQQQSTILNKPPGGGGDDDDWSDFVSNTPKMIQGPNFPSWNSPQQQQQQQLQRPPQFNSWNQPTSFFQPTQNQSINLPPLSNISQQQQHQHTFLSTVVPTISNNNNTNSYYNNTSHNNLPNNITITQQTPSISLIPDLGFAAPPKPVIQLNPTQFQQHKKSLSLSSSSSSSSSVAKSSNSTINNSTIAGYHQTKMMGKK